MRSFLFALASTAALTVPAAPAFANDLPAAPPIIIERCTALEQPYIENPKIGLRLPQLSGITIVYTNARNAAATEIRFVIRYRGVVSTVVDRGSIASGAKISREFSTIDAIFSGSAADCRVTAATFADGTHWDAPAPVSGAPGH